MAKEGSVAPKERINVTFKPALGDVKEEIELPLKLLVVGDFTQRADDRNVEDRKPIGIDKHNFDEVMAKQSLSLALNVPNRLQDAPVDEELALQVRLSSIKDFGPASLVQQIPQLKALMDLRDALVALKGPLGNTPAFRNAIEAALQDEQARARVLSELDLATDATPAQA